MRRRSLTGVAIVVGALASACGTGPSKLPRFSTGWTDDRGESIAAVEARLRGAPRGPSTDLVVSVAGADEIIGTPLGAGAQWTARHALDTRPIIAGGGVVVVSGGGEVAALDAGTGKQLWARPTAGLPLLGAGDDGELTALTLSRGAGSTLLVVGRDGAVKQQIETEQALGAPAVVAGVVFVPWASQYVSAIDARTGDELGRVTLRDKATRATPLGGELYFGELAFVRFDAQIGGASRGQASRVALPSRDLPGTPRLVTPGTERVPPSANARDRDRLFARPSGAQGGPLGIDSGRFYASYYRLLFGFGAADAELAWVRAHDRDLIGGEAVSGGVLVCEEGGRLVVLDGKTGQIAMEKEIGERIASCVVRADTFQAPRPTSAAPPLGEQIAAAAALPEPTLATAQRLLVGELAAREDASATKALIDLASDPRTSPVLVADARAALAKRRTGAAFMLAALERRYDYLRDVLASPPVGPIADALASMKEAKAAPLLAACLFEPELTDDDVRRAAGALAVLGTPKELPALERFFAMYRGTAPSDPIAVAVGSVAEAMLRLDAKASRPRVEVAAKDPMTAPAALATGSSGRQRSFGTAPSWIPRMSSRAKRQHSVPAGNSRQAWGRIS